MCDEAGVSGQNTNHSLRVSGTTSLFSAGVPERVIQGRSGHSSLEALRKIRESQCRPGTCCVKNTIR